MKEVQVFNCLSRIWPREKCYSNWGENCFQKWVMYWRHVSGIIVQKEVSFEVSKLLWKILLAIFTSNRQIRMHMCMDVLWFNHTGQLNTTQPLLGQYAKWHTVFTDLVIDLTWLTGYTEYIFFIKRSISGCTPMLIQKQEERNSL